VLTFLLWVSSVHLPIMTNWIFNMNHTIGSILSIERLTLREMKIACDMTDHSSSNNSSCIFKPF
jgi:hypothetical protein